MKNTMKIGLLLPNSGILPMARTFEEGIKDELGMLETQPELIVELISNGDLKATGDAIRKFQEYHGAEIITGILNDRAVNSLAPKFQSKKSILLVNNLGETWPNPDVYGKTVFLNSFNLWQQIWALSKWAVEHIGTKGMYAAGLFDSGFSFISAMDLGMRASSTENKWAFAIAPAPGAIDGDLAQVHEVIPHIQREKPDFVFANFCGKEASLFLECFVNAGLHKEVALIGLPYLIEPFENPNNEEIKFHTSRLRRKNGNQQISPFEWKKDYFELGKVTGSILREAISSETPVDEALSSMTEIKGLGTINLDARQAGSEFEIVRYDVRLFGEVESGEVLATEVIESSDYNNPDLVSISQADSSGWFNPYLAI